MIELLPGVPVLPLHGQVDPAGQRAAIRRDPQGRPLLSWRVALLPFLVAVALSPVVSRGRVERASLSGFFEQLPELLG